MNGRFAWQQCVVIRRSVLWCLRVCFPLTPDPFSRSGGEGSMLCFLVVKRAVPPSPLEVESGLEPVLFCGISFRLSCISSLWQGCHEPLTPDPLPRAWARGGLVASQGL